MKEICYFQESLKCVEYLKNLKVRKQRNQYGIIVKKRHIKKYNKNA